MFVFVFVDVFAGNVLASNIKRAPSCSDLRYSLCNSARFTFTMSVLSVTVTGFYPGGLPSTLLHTQCRLG